MSTLLSKNRFSVLMDKPKVIEKDKNVNEKVVIKPEENKFNSFKNDKQPLQKNYRNEYRSHQEYDYRRLNLEDKQKKAKENEIKILTNVDNFPELKSSVKKEKTEKNEDTINYFSKLINSNDSSQINNEKMGINNGNYDENVPEGCVCIKFNKKENNLKWIYGNGFINTSDYNKETIESKMNQCDNPFIVMSRLVKLNRIRRNDYIRKWGKDEYEYMFMFPNYDYKYYDKVDEEYYDVEDYEY
jgi:hypothetical protein